MVLWSNSSLLDRDVEGSNLARGRSQGFNFFQHRILSVFISRKKMESRGRREEMERGKLFYYISISVTLSIQGVIPLPGRGIVGKNQSAQSKTTVGAFINDAKQLGGRVGSLFCHSLYRVVSKIAI